MTFVKGHPYGKRFKKGHKPWNTGKKLPFDVWNKGKKWPEIKKWLKKYQFKKGHQFWLGKKRPNISGKNHPNWIGGIVKRDGYILILQPSHPFAKNGYIKRATLVMEKMIGRYLIPPELVHHKNKIRDDDKPKNLKLFPNPSKHQRFHKLNVSQ